MSIQTSKQIFTTARNIGFIDREIRLLFGAGLIVAVFVAPGPIGWWALAPLLAIPLIITAVIAWDPVYALLSTNTDRGEQGDIQQRTWSSPNIGALDRGLRVGIGTGLIAALLVAEPIAGTTVTVLLAVPIMVSAIIAWDPVYALASVNTFESKADVATVGPELDDRTLARMYSFNSYRHEQTGFEHYSRAA